MRMVRDLVFMLMVDERFEGSLDVGECDRFEGVLGLGRGLGWQTGAQGEAVQRPGGHGGVWHDLAHKPLVGLPLPITFHPANIIV